MAKTKARLNKAQAIRDFLAANPNVGPTEVAKTLTEKHKTKFSVAQVSNLKNAKKGKKAKRGPKGNQLRSPGNIVGNGLVETVEFVRVAGGIKNAKRLLLDLESLVNG